MNSTPKKILVVDDNQVMLRFLHKLLEADGHHVVTVEDGLTALGILPSFQPDIAILDLVLPKIGGDKLCRIIRRMHNLQNCYVIILSAAASEMDVEPTALGADTCIAKGPFNAMTEHVRQAIAISESPHLAGQQVTVYGMEQVNERRMTRELLSQVRHLESVLESIDEGILEVYANRIIYANEAAMAIFNLPQEKLLAANPADLFTDKAARRVAELLEQQGSGRAAIGLDQPVSRKGRQLTIKRLPLVDKATTTILLVTDVTERKRLEIQLQHAQKMEAIGTIASGVAHNFRNTLAGILMNSQMIQVHSKNDKQLSELAQRINTAVKRGAELVDGLVHFSRKQIKKELQPVDLMELIAETNQLVETSFEKKINIEVSGPRALPTYGDPPGLSLALMNLCTNARDAMPQGGTLKIEARQQKEMAIISVTDTGMGMDADTQTKCFDPFFTTKEVGKGTGLGLSTTYGIIKGHEGHITVRSKPGDGATFTVTLPIRASANGAANEMPDADHRLGNGEKVLVVDDDADIGRVAPNLLTSIGYLAEVVVSPHDALQRYKSWRPDVVLLDRNMPQMDGLTCAEQIIAIDPAARIAIISGYEQDGPNGIPPEKQALLKGYLTKPFELSELSRLLAKILK